jgi:tRNA U34 5-carboxymethylaminomethyl modifying enzyme MnmG/GidA
VFGKIDDPLVVEQLEISAKYQGYIDRQAEEVAKSASYENTALPADLDYARSPACPTRSSRSWPSTSRRPSARPRASRASRRRRFRCC